MSALKTGLTIAKFFLDWGREIITSPKRAPDIEVLQATTDEALRRAMPPKKPRRGKL
jgi:hypothetical protein